MAKPRTRSRTIPKGTVLRIRVEGQSGSAVCTAGALEAGDFVNWTPQLLQSGVSYRPKGPCAIEFLADFLASDSPGLTVTVSGGPKTPTTWKVGRADGARQTWQLWVLIK